MPWQQTSREVHQPLSKRVYHAFAGRVEYPLLISPSDPTTSLSTFTPTSINTIKRTKESERTLTV